MNRLLSPEIKQAIDFHLSLKPYEYFVLNNGIPVYLFSGGSQEVVQLELVFFSGNFYEAKTAVAGLTNSLIRCGTKTRTAFELSEAFDYYGSYFGSSCFSETATITLHGLSKYLNKVLPLMRDLLTEATYPENELNIHRKNFKQRLVVNLKKCEFVAGRQIDEMLFGNKHPYGRKIELGDLDDITVEDIRSFYDRYYKNGSCAIFISGWLPNDVQQQLNLALGDLPLQRPDFVIPELPLAPATERIVRIENDSSSVQGAIRLATPFPNRHHADFNKAGVLNALFGGFFGSRLMSNIREDKGYTYGIYSFFKANMKQNAWLISTEAGKDVCEAAIEEIYKEMDKLCNEEVEEDELLLVKNYLLGAVLGTLDGPFQILGRWKNIILNNLDENYFSNSIHDIKTVTPAEIKALAQKYLQPENFFELVVY